jgi:hypothetical protein
LINLVYIFWLFVWHLVLKEVSEGKVTVHDRVEIINLDAVLKYYRFLMMTHETWKSAYDTFSRDYSSFFLALEPPAT